MRKNLFKQIGIWLMTIICLSSLTVKAANESKLEIYAAWYGTEQNHVEKIGSQSIIDIIKSNMSGNTLIIPKNMNEFFGKDPYPGVPKVLAVQVGYNQGRYGEVWNLRQAEGQNLIFPGTIGETYMLAPPDSPVTVNAARYGIDTTPVSADALRRINDKKNQLNGNVYVPADMNTFFGGDPNPRIKKSLAINVTYKGRTFNLRQVEGRALRYPGILGTDFIYVYTEAEVPDSKIKSIFNSKFYVFKYQDVGDEIDDNNAEALWNHYINYGIKEGRDPNPNISIGAMQSRYPILQEYFGDNYKQYILTYLGSGNINADPSSKNFPNADNGAFADPGLAYFDPDWYYLHNPSVCNDSSLSIPKGSNYCKSNQNASMDVPALVSHYLTVGAKNKYTVNNITGKAPPVDVATAFSANGKESMQGGEWLGPGEYLISRDGSTIALVQGNNFGIYKTNDPKKVAANNRGCCFASFFVPNFNTNDPSDHFLYLGVDGHLCMYRGTSPYDNKGVDYCVGNENPRGHYFLRLDANAATPNKKEYNNLVIRTGDSMYNHGNVIWDMLTKKPGTPGPFDSIIKTIKSGLGCN